MRIKGIQVQQINPINLLWPFLTWHTTNVHHPSTTNHLSSGLWQGRPSSSDLANHGLAPGNNPLVGWKGSYPVVGFWSLPFNLQGNFPLHSFWWNADGDCRLPKIPSMALGSQENQMTRQLSITGGGGTHTQTFTSTIVSGPIWSKGWSGFNKLIGLISMIWSSSACSGWGSWTGPVPMIVFIKRLRPFNIPRPCISIPFPVLWNLNTG